MAADLVSFRFQVKPAKPLKSVFELLCDTSYNPTGLARIDVIGDDFRLTVGKSSNGFQAQFSLDKNEVGGFECNESVVGKVVNLSEVVQKMGIQIKDSVTVSHTLTSDKLSFIIKNPDEECVNAFTTIVLPNTVGIDVFPVVNILLERITDSEYVDEDKFPQWPYNTMLKLASLLCPYVYSSFPTMPPNSMVLRFPLPNLGVLMFIKDRVFDETLANVSASLTELLPGPTSSADPNECSETFSQHSSHKNTPDLSDDNQPEAENPLPHSDLNDDDSLYGFPTPARKFSLSNESYNLFGLFDHDVNNDSHVFSFKLRDTVSLKLGLEVLTEPNLNPTQMGRIDVDVGGLVISCWNQEHVCTALFFDTACLSDFKLSRPAFWLPVNLPSFLKELRDTTSESVSLAYYEVDPDRILEESMDPSF